LTKRLRLPYLRRALTDLVPTAKAQRWDPAEVVRVLLAEEAAGRDATNLRTRRKRAGFPAGKTFGDWDEAASSIPRPTQDALKTLEWVKNKESLCICGPSGTGKSHFCEALGQAAVEDGLTVAWFTIEDLGALMRRHRVDDSIARAITRVIRTDLIIVDDIGLLPVSPDAAEGFYRLVDAAYERRAMAVSSNLHPSGFDEIMPKTLATATVDRLLHHAHVVVTQGDSFRLAQATSGQGVKPPAVTTAQLNGVGLGPNTRARRSRRSPSMSTYVRGAWKNHSWPSKSRAPHSRTP
jgi:DNA replication protein DnaC